MDANISNKISGEDFILIFRKGQVKTKPIIAVSKGIVHKAVERNRIRRIISEAIRQLKIQEGELTVIVKKNIAAAKSTEVAAKISALIQNNDRKNH